MDKEPLSLRFAKNVELNRQKLIQHCIINNVNVPEDISLTDVVAVNNSLPIAPDNEEHPNKHEVRFFDIDGNQIGDSIWVEHGGSVTPPEAPIFDPERLEFKRWASAIGNTFDNIQHDVDYLPRYEPKNGVTYIFATFDDSTGYDVSLKLTTSTYNVPSRTRKYTIDWGDGTVVETASASVTVSHTFVEGDYIISITPNWEPVLESPNIQEMYYIQHYQKQVLNGNQSTSSTQRIDNAITRLYTPFLYYGVQGKNLKYLVYGAIGSANGYCSIPVSTATLIVTDKFAEVGYTGSVGSAGGLSLQQNNNNPSRLKVLVIEPYTGRGWRLDYYNISLYVHLDKLIIPNISDDFSTISNSCPYKLVHAGSGFCKSSNQSMLQELHVVNYVNQFPQVPRGTRLKKLTHAGYGELTTFTGTTLKEFYLPTTCTTVSSSALTHNYSLEYLGVYPDFDASLLLTMCNVLTPKCVLDMLNSIKDNSSEAVTRTLTFAMPPYITITTSWVKKGDTGLYSYCDEFEDGATPMIDAFNAKNWTISVNTSTSLT